MEGHLGHSRCVPEQALTICPWRLIHSENLWRAQLKKALSQKESLRLFQQALNQTLREGKETSSPKTLLYEPRVLTVTCVQRCSPAISVHKQQRCLKSVILIYIGDCIPVLFTTEFLFPKTITLLVEKSGFEYFLFEIICVSKMGFAQPVPVPQQRTELIFLSQKGCIQACMALLSSRRLEFFQC